MNNKYVKRWRTENNCLPLVFNDIFTPRGVTFIMLFEICNFQFTDIEVYEVGNS